MNLIIFLIWSYMLGCQSASGNFAEAKRLEEAGKLSQAFDLYIQLEKSPVKSISKKASKSLQKIYLNHAKSQEESDPQKSIQLYQKMLERWPQDNTVAALAEKKIDDLQKQGMKRPEQKNERASETKSEDLVFCEKAEAASSRIVWQQYKQQYPQGSCLDKAEDFLQGSQPRDSELKEMKELVSECSAVLKASCQEYNLAKTTSDSSACAHANRAFSNEIQRLIRRKRTLLADGNKDYYEQFIPKRWNAVKSGIDIACQASRGYLAEKETLGIDLTSFQEIVQGQCGICLEDFGDIDSL